VGGGSHAAVLAGRAVGVGRDGRIVVAATTGPALGGSDATR
jgi:hypothetical protein